MAYEIEGTIKHISETETFASGFCKRFLILEAQDGDYKNEYGFEVMKDNVDKYDSLSIGQEVKVHFSLATTREGTGGYEGKWFPNMHRAWKVEALSDAAPVSDDPHAEEDIDQTIPF